MKWRYTGNISITYTDRKIVHNGVVLETDKQASYGSIAATMVREFKAGLKTKGIYHAEVTREEAPWKR